MIEAFETVVDRRITVQLKVSGCGDLLNIFLEEPDIAGDIFN